MQHSRLRTCWRYIGISFFLQITMLHWYKGVAICCMSSKCQIGNTALIIERYFVHVWLKNKNHICQKFHWLMKQLGQSSIACLFREEWGGVQQMYKFTRMMAMAVHKPLISRTWQPNDYRKLESDCPHLPSHREDNIKRVNVMRIITLRVSDNILKYHDKTYNSMAITTIMILILLGHISLNYCRYSLLFTQVTFKERNWSQLT